jgi:hypothetical protein
MWSQHGDDSDTSDEEFPDIEDPEDIANTPVKECLELLKRSLVPESEEGVLRESFAMFVQFAFEISRRIEELSNRHYEGESPFFKWMEETLLEGAKVMRRRKVMPEKKTLSTILAIGEFEKVFDVFVTKKKRAAPKEGQSTPAKAAAGKSTAEKASEKKEPAAKMETPAEEREPGKMDKELEERLEKAFEKLLMEQK